jgi:segregation and condensation protein B
MKQPEVQSAPETEGAIPEELLHASPLSASDSADAQLKALVEAVIYITDEPLSADQIAIALSQPAEKVGRVLEELTAEYNKPEHGLTVREIAGGYKMSTKPEHHEAIRAFVKNLKPALKLSLAALETLALIAYKQPITAPEVMDVRGVQGAGVLKTLLDRKLIATSGRKQVVGKPILYKTTKEFLVQFGLKDLTELPTLKEFEELSRLSVADSDNEIQPAEHAEAAAAQAHSEPEAEAESSE